MKGAIAELNDREQSIIRLLTHIDEVSETKGKIEVIVVLKSSVFVALYNNIEATIYSIIERMHDSISNCTYDEVADALKQKMVRYSFGKSASAHIQDAVKVAAEREKLISSKQFFPELAAFLKRQDIFSGNVDVRKLNLIAVSYGMQKINFERKDAELMLWVKNKRNKIAHGEQSMSDGGTGIKTTDLKRAHRSTSIILRKFITSVELFLAEEKYRNTSL
jgi:hypothetical protein